MPEETAQQQIRIERRMRALEKHVENLPTKDEVEEIVRNTIKETLLLSGRGAKAVIITTAAIVAALAIIGGGLKFLLGLIGFHFIVK